MATLSISACPRAFRRARGLPFRGTRVPFLNYQKRIYRAAAQTGPAALSIQTSSKSPYDDEILADGFLDAYRVARSISPTTGHSGPRMSHKFPSSTSSGRGQAGTSRSSPATCGKRTPPDGWCLRQARYVVHSTNSLPIPLEDPLERRYAVRETRVRLHQARFRGRVVPAYNSQCAICRLRELRLLDAAHIVGDLEESGEPVVTNGLSLCSIHHRAFDQNLVGVSADYVVHVSRRLREEEDGPMLDLLKGFHEGLLNLPRRGVDRPDRERLDTRFAQFLHLAG